ncbi:hypothetical protein QO002_005669 [Pararhizobium capsulatum DSM 1112]|uniref:Uncharacterized protein n=1 Tax=Pararhizobium capsulatum DSM 1112 TaxID=1121113 RepID=A0ABU0BYX0_9HYPH|nr:hypothetical protein [Pararhizobium capsulatum]MDQ0323463.1 hypothetical protein [Pararhizobium capsulatum DSM 1112]
MPMQRVLEKVGDDWIAITDLAAIVAGIPGEKVSKSAANGTRLRCQQLVEAGLVELGYQDQLTGAVWKHRGEQRVRLVVRRLESLG